MGFNSLEDYVMNAGNNRNAAVFNSLLESEPGMKELPANPVEDGTYSLKNTVENGESTVSWSEGGSGGDSGALVCHMEMVDWDGYEIQFVLDHTGRELLAALPNIILIDEQEEHYEYEGNISDSTTGYVNQLTGYFMGETISESLEESHYFGFLFKIGFYSGGGLAYKDAQFMCEDLDDYPYGYISNQEDDDEQEDDDGLSKVLVLDIETISTRGEEDEHQIQTSISDIKDAPYVVCRWSGETKWGESFLYPVIEIGANRMVVEKKIYDSQNGTITTEPWIFRPDNDIMTDRIIK